MYGRGKELRKPRTQKESEENKINSIRNPLILKKKKKKEIKTRLVKNKIIRDIRTLFETEEKNERN